MLKYLNELIYMGINISYNVISLSFLAFASIFCSYIHRFFSMFLITFFYIYLGNITEAISRPAKIHVRVLYLRERSIYQDKSKQD